MIVLTKNTRLSVLNQVLKSYICLSFNLDFVTTNFFQTHCSKNFDIFWRCGCSKLVLKFWVILSLSSYKVCAYKKSVYVLDTFFCKKSRHGSTLDFAFLTILSNLAIGFFYSAKILKGSNPLINAETDSDTQSPSIHHLEPHNTSPSKSLFYRDPIAIFSPRSRYLPNYNYR